MNRYHATFRLPEGNRKGAIVLTCTVVPSGDEERQVWSLHDIVNGIMLEPGLYCAIDDQGSRCKVAKLAEIDRDSGMLTLEEYPGICHCDVSHS